MVSVGYDGSLKAIVGGIGEKEVRDVYKRQAMARAIERMLADGGRAGQRHLLHKAGKLPRAVGVFLRGVDVGIVVVLSLIHI